MKRLSFAIAVLCLFASFSSFASKTATVTLPEHFNLISLNGVQQSTTARGQVAKIDVAAGAVKLVVQYSDMVEASDGSVEKVRSRDLIIVIETLPGMTYRVEAPRPKTLLQARDFANSPTYNVYKLDESGNKAEVSVVEGDNLEALKNIWQRLSSDQKAAFLDWVSIQ
ncbi:MAG: DUF2057 family protein [Gammaproteobacteria bacterium]|nr:DUF2057 family protein [Gammaproteobacteria bacterium]NVK87711.1 DUF2057 family protein [Gammaproteobacteria bacterium]